MILGTRAPCFGGLEFWGKAALKRSWVPFGVFGVVFGSTFGNYTRMICFEICEVVSELPE